MQDKKILDGSTIKEKKVKKDFNFKSRLKAVLIHLFFSLILFGIFMFVVLEYWFPGPHFFYNGGWEGTKIMILVDLVVGPLITFFIFNTNKPKKEIIFDLLIILIIQIALFGFGYLKIKEMHPVVQVLLERGVVKTTYLQAIRTQNNIYTEDKRLKLNSTKNYPAFYYADSSYRDNNSKRLQKRYAIFPGMNDVDATFMYEDPTKESVLNKIRKISLKSKLSLLENSRYKKSISDFEKENKGEFHFFNIKLQHGEGVMVMDGKGFPVDYIDMHYYGK